MKGVILAGGNGTRLRPLTFIQNKHLIPVYNKPMIMFPIDTLKGMGITDILIVSGGEHIGKFIEYLGDGSLFDIKLTYKVQTSAGGIAQALSLAEDFVSEQFAVILGDNIYESSVIPPPAGCGIVLKEVADPRRFGVFADGEIIEKPTEPKSKMAVTGLYFYTKQIFDFIKTLTPSARGELEITDVNNWCLKNLPTATMVYEGFWSDAGTFESLAESSNWVRNQKQTV